MKKIIIKILLFISILSFFNVNIVWNTYAEGIKVKVTEKVPWANCGEKLPESEWWWYECTVAKWFWSVIIMLWNIIKYFTFIASLWGVLFIIVNGIMYSMWWIDEWIKSDAKKRIVWTLIWLALLFLSWVILNLIAPWIYK